AVWFVAKHELYDQLDQTLQSQVPNGPFGGNSPFTVAIHSDGDVTGYLAGHVDTRRARSVIGAGGGEYFANGVVTNTDRGDVAVREYVLANADSALITVQPLAPTLHALAHPLLDPARRRSQHRARGGARRSRRHRRAPTRSQADEGGRDGRGDGRPVGARGGRGRRRARPARRALQRDAPGAGGFGRAAEAAR